MVVTCMDIGQEPGQIVADVGQRQRHDPQGYATARPQQGFFLLPHPPDPIRTKSPT